MSAEQKMAERHSKVTEEIIASEFVFQESMQLLLQEYILPLEQVTNDPRLGAASDPEVAVVFSNVRHIYTLSKKLWEDLKTARAEWLEDESNQNREPVAEIMYKFAPLFALYSRYAALHLECNEVLVQRQTQHSEFREFLGKIQLKVKVSLDSLLIAPVQRVPRYILLLKELRSCLSANHPDFRRLEEALEAVEKAAETINKVTGEREELNRVLELEKKFAGDIFLVTPDTAYTRKYIMHEKLKKVSRKKSISYIFVLFTDLLIYCEESRSGWIPHRVLELRNSAVSDTGPGTNERTFVFRNTHKSFEVKCPDPASKQRWVVALSQNITRWCIEFVKDRYEEEQEQILRQLEEPLPEATSAVGNSVALPAVNPSQSLTRESSQAQGLGGPQSSARARKKRVQQQLEEAAAKHQTVLEAVKEGEDPRDLRFAPVMNFKKGTDGWEDLKNCCVCKEKLKRKMQCKLCGLYACKTPCGAFTMIVPLIDSKKPQGVCQSCFHAEKRRMHAKVPAALEVRKVGDSPKSGQATIAIPSKGRRLSISVSASNVSRRRPSVVHSQSGPLPASPSNAKPGDRTLGHVGGTLVSANTASAAAILFGPNHPLANPAASPPGRRSSIAPMTQNAFGEDVEDSSSGSSAHIHPSQRFLARNKRWRVAREILDSERVYVAQLETLLTVYIRPLLLKSIGAVGGRAVLVDEDGRLLPALPKLSAFMAVFCNSLEQIFILNSKLLHDLDERLQDWDHQAKMSDIFQQFGPLFTIYSQFMSNYVSALSVFNQSAVQAHMNNQARSFDNEQLHGQKIQEYLILPILRVPQYQELLQEMQKQTSQFHVDAPTIAEALEEVRKAVRRLERAQAEKERLNALIQIQNSFLGSHEILIRPGRALVQDGARGLWVSPSGTSHGSYHLHSASRKALEAEDEARRAAASLLSAGDKKKKKDSKTKKPKRAPKHKTYGHPVRLLLCSDALLLAYKLDTGSSSSSPDKVSPTAAGGFSFEEPGYDVPETFYIGNPEEEWKLTCEHRLPKKVKSGTSGNLEIVSVTLESRPTQTKITITSDTPAQLESWKESLSALIQDGPVLRQDVAEAEAEEEEEKQMQAVRALQEEEERHHRTILPSQLQSQGGKGRFRALSMAPDQAEK